MISLQIGGVEKLYKTAKNFRDLKSKLPSQIKGLMNTWSLKVLRSIKEDYLSGPRPAKLGVVTGLLRSSIRAKVAGDEKSITAVFGTNVPYAPTHEYGSHDTVPVPAHQRSITQAFGRKLKQPKTVMVRSHSMKMNIKARPFLKPGVGDNIADLKADLARLARGSYVK